MPVISCLDIGDKIDPSRLEVADISRTTVCPAARIIKKELRKQGIRKLKVLYSREQPAKEKLFRRRRTMVKKPAEGNISFVTGTAGYLLAGEIERRSRTDPVHEHESRRNSNVCFTEIKQKD